MTDHQYRDRVSELERDNRRLRILLDQRDAPSELRHRLRSTVALLRGVVRRSAETKRDLPSYVAHLEDRLDAIMRAQAFADDHGDVDLRALLAEELLHYGAHEGDNLTISGPEIRLAPKSGQIFALAIHELAVNAVEHGRLGVDGGAIDVRWSVTGVKPDAVMTFVWKERGSTSGIGVSRPGFGTEVMMKILPYELQAKTDTSVDEQGLVWEVRMPFPDRTGGVLAS